MSPEDKQFIHVQNETKVNIDFDILNIMIEKDNYKQDYKFH